MWRSSIGSSRFAIGRVACFDDNVEDQAAPASDKVELLAVACIAGAFDDDIGVRLEQADEFLASRRLFTLQHPPLALPGNALDQRPVMARLGLQSTACGPLCLESCASASRSWVKVARQMPISSR